MISIAVAELELRSFTISPETYFAFPEGAVVTALVFVVVFVVLEFSVHPVKKTQEIRSNTRPHTRRVFLFMVFNSPGNYLKNRFTRICCFNTLVPVRIDVTPDYSMKKRDVGRNNERKSRNDYSSFFSGRLNVSTSVISDIPLINSNPSWMILLRQRSQRRS